MNFYKKYPGDYLRDTAHLSLAEHGAYSLMLDYHYSTEKPLPKGRELYRLLRAEKTSERRGIDRVLSEFWVENEDGFIHKRAQKEFEKLDKKRALARENGALGGRPKNQDDNRKETDIGYLSVSNEKAIQTPDTRHQTLVTHTRPTLEQVMARMQGRVPDYQTLAELFYQNYEAKGWKINGHPVENWKALVDKWILEGKTNANSKPTGRGRESKSERSDRAARDYLASLGEDDGGGMAWVEGDGTGAH